jgi:CBS domain-containing protein
MNETLTGTIDKVMTRKFHTVTEHDTIKDAYDILMDEDLRAMPVLTNEGDLAGIISERDIIRYRTRNILPKHADFYINVSDVMTEEVKTLSPDTSIERACSQFVEWGHHQVPIVEGGDVVGLLGHHDLLRFFSQNWDNIVDVAGE